MRVSAESKSRRPRADAPWLLVRLVDPFDNPIKLPDGDKHRA